MGYEQLSCITIDQKRFITDMHIERATSDDCCAIASVHVMSWQQAYKGLLPAEYLASLSVQQREVIWRESVDKGLPQLLVAKREGEISGFAAFGPSRDEGAKPDCAEIWAIYVAPSSWSLGLGRMLWLASLEILLAQGFKTVSLWVIAGNERAIKFYSAAGFKPEPTSIKEFTLGGVQLQEIRYVFRGDA